MESKGPKHQYLFSLDKEYQKLTTELKKLNSQEIKAINNFLLNAEIKANVEIENIHTTLARLEYAARQTRLDSKNNQDRQTIKLKTMLIEGQKLFDQKPKINLSDLLQILSQSGIKETQQTRIKPAHLNGLPWITLAKPENIITHLNEFIVYFNSSQPINNLNLKEIASLTHWYYELIHPFSDGNGRTGRVLLYLFFYSHKLWPREIYMPLSHIMKSKKNNSGITYYIKQMDIFQSKGKEILANFIRQNPIVNGLNVFYQQNKNHFISFLNTMHLFYLETFQKVLSFIKKFQKQKELTKKILTKLIEKDKKNLLGIKKEKINDFEKFLLSKPVIYIDDLKVFFSFKGKWIKIKIINFMNKLENFEKKQLQKKKTKGFSNTFFVNYELFYFFN